MDMLFNLIKKPSQQESFGFGLENQEFTSNPYNSDHFDTAKQLQNFNNEMSEIQIGNEQIDQDSIDQIKKQHKLLSGRRSTLQNKKNSNESDSSSKVALNGPPVLQNKDSQKKQSKLSIQSKFGKSAIILTRQNFKSIQNNNKNKNSSQSGGLQTRNYSYELKKSKNSILKQITKSISSFNLIKKELLAFAKNEQTQFYKLKIKLIRTFEQKLQLFLKQKEKQKQKQKQKLVKNYEEILKSQKQSQNNHTRKRSNAQDYSLLYSQLKLKMQKKEQELEQITRQNQSLQQHIFDIQQRIVGVDLQVQQRLQAKKKQIQQRIMKNIKNNNVSNEKGANMQTLKMLTEQNESLSKKIIYYQQTIDEVNKKSDQLQQKQFKLHQMQKEIMDGFQNLQQHESKLLKKQSELTVVQKNLNYKLGSLKQEIRQKQIELSQWQNQIQKRIKRQKIIQKVDHQIGMLQSQSLSTPRTPQLKNNQSFGIRLPLADSKRYNDQSQMLQNTIKTQRKNKWSEGLLDSFCKKDRGNLPNKNQIDHIYDYANDQTINVNANVNANVNGLVYDPKKHQQYQKFDYKQRMNQQSSRLHQQSFIPTHHQIKKIPQFYSSKVSSKAVQFYQPTSNNSFRYQPQYKPSSVLSNLTKSNMKQYIYEHRKSKQDRDKDILKRPIMSTKNFGLLNNSNSQSQSQSHNSHSQSYGNLKYHNVLNRSNSKDNNIKLTSLGNKLQELKAEIKHQIDSIN